MSASVLARTTYSRKFGHYLLAHPWVLKSRTGFP
jgi:hypothetical protein